MTMSAEFCRTQVTNQRQRAADSPLGNVREIAARAAATWEGEALIAELREHRRRVARAATEAKLRGRDDMALSENPDRGRASERPTAEWTRDV